MVSDKTKALQLLQQKRIPTKMESTKTSKAFIRRRKSRIHVDRHIGGTQRESRPAAAAAAAAKLLQCV